MFFEIIGDVRDVETIALGGAIRTLARLRRLYGAARWRKLKDVAVVRLEDGALARTELHWYEAHGIGRREVKLERWIGMLP